MEIVRRYGRYFLSGEDRDDILRSANADRDCEDPSRTSIICEQAIGYDSNRRAQRDADDRGHLYDYSAVRYLIVDRSTLLRYLPDQPATNAAIYLAHGADAERVQQDLQLRTAGYGVATAPNAALRQAAIEIFDRTFAITWALEAVAILVAMLGAANSLLALVLDRRRELGLLRYLGASAQQVRRMILTEAAFLGLLALLLGLALGFALSLLLFFVVNKQSFGWTIQFHPPIGLLSGALVLVWA